MSVRINVRVSVRHTAIHAIQGSKGWDPPPRERGSKGPRVQWSKGPRVGIHRHEREGKAESGPKARWRSVARFRVRVRVRVRARWRSVARARG